MKVGRWSALAGAAVLGMLAAALPAATQTAPKPHRVIISTPGPALDFFPAYLASAADLFDSEGLEAVWLDIHAGSRQIEPLSGHDVVVTVLGLQPAVAATAGGAEFVAFAALFNGNPIQVVLHPDNYRRVGIKAGMGIDEKVRRLSGLRIGVTSAGSQEDATIRTLFLTRSMDPDKAIQVQMLGSTDALLAALEKKTIDGAMLPAQQAGVAEAGGYGITAIDVLGGDAPEFAGVPSTAMIASRETIRRHPETLLRIVRVLAKAMLLQDRDPDQTQKLLQQKIFPATDPKVFASFESAYAAAAAKTPVILQDDYRRFAGLRKILEPTATVVPYETMVNTDFAKRAAAEILAR